jgi:hypothetical protein
MPNCLPLTETGIDNFKIFIKFLAENDLIEKAANHLKAKGHDKIRVSIEPILEIQAFIKEEFESRGEVSKSAQMIIQSAHNNC